MADKVIVVIQENVSTLTTERFNLLTSQNEQSTIVVAEENVSIISEAIQGPRGPTGDTGATGPAGENGQGVPTGGTTGQVLAKASATNYDTQWINLLGGLAYQGAWNASTNTPTLTSSVGTNGYYYIVSVAGSTNLNGITDWQIGDWAIFNGTAWQKIDQSNLVVSVNGQTGAVVLTAASVGAVASVVAGVNISINNTDPQNPIVNSLSDRYKTTSSTSNSIVSSGSLTFTVSANLSYIPMQEVLIVYDASNHMHASVTSYSGTTLVVDIKQKTGSGTYSSWTINLDGTPVDALTGSGTANQLAYFTSGQVLGSLSTATYPSLTETSYVKGVTGSIQAQIDSKVDGTLTAGRIPFASDPNTLTDTSALAWDSVLNNLYIAPTLGSELITNGTFTGSATGWTVPSGWAYSANTVVHSSNGTGALQPSTALTTVVAGQLYEYSYTISAWTAGTVTMSCGGVTQSAVGANGTYTGRFLATSNANLLFTPTNTSRFTIDSVSLKRLSGGMLLSGSVNTNTLTGIQSGLGATTPTDAVVLDNRTAATSSLNQVSPSTRWSGKGWNTSSSQSNNVDFRAFSLPNASTNVPAATWKLQGFSNGSWLDLLSVNSATTGTSSGVTIHSATAHSNSSPGTQRIATFANSGSNTWIDFTFAGTAFSYMGATNSGELSLWTKGGNFFSLYDLNTGALYNYNTPSTFGHYGSGGFAGGVNAGSPNVPSSTLQSQGSLALKVGVLTSNGNIDGSATHWLIDASSSAACTGTPTYSCSHWTNQSDCELRDSHGGCNWFSGNSCSVFNNEYNMGSCSGTSGCSADTSSCSGAGDESSCLNQNSAYGGSCAWSASPASCAGFDQSTCIATTGCSVDTGYCTNNYTNCWWDGSVCNGGGSCSSYSDESTCNSSNYWTSCSGGGDCGSLPDETSCTSYSYYNGCSGTYDIYSCTGNFFSGNCSGLYGAACQGTSSCGGIDDSGSCGGEAGCTWSSVLTATLPNGEACPDRTYWIYNDSSGGADVVLQAQGGQTIDNAGSTYTLSAYKEWVHLAYFKKTATCAGLDESACGSTSGCTQNYSGCSWDGSVCSGGGGCSSQGDEGSCLSYTYYSGCSGSYTVSKNWYKFGS